MAFDRFRVDTQRASVSRVVLSAFVLALALPTSVIFFANAFGLAISLVPAVLYLIWVMLVDVFALARSLVANPSLTFPARRAYPFWLGIAVVTCLSWYAWLLTTAEWTA